MSYPSLADIENAPESTNEFVRRHSNIFVKIVDKLVQCKPCGETLKAVSACTLRKHLQTGMHRLLVDWPQEDRGHLSKKVVIQFRTYLKLYEYLARESDTLVCMLCNTVFTVTKFDQIRKHHKTFHIQSETDKVAQDCFEIQEFCGGIKRKLNLNIKDKM